MARALRSKLASHTLWKGRRPAAPSSGTFTADPFCASVRQWIAAIPAGKVATYGQIAHLAGKPWGARQVAWILHSQSDKYRLPWQRVIGANGRISLPPGKGFAEQRRLLTVEGVAVDGSGRIDLNVYRWLAEDEFPAE